MQTNSWSTMILVLAYLAAGAGTPVAAQIERISLVDDGSQANAGSAQAAISDDGSIVAFHSNATNLVLGDSNGWGDVFVRDLDAGTTEIVSLRPDGSETARRPIQCLSQIRPLSQSWLHPDKNGFSRRCFLIALENAKTGVYSSGDRDVCCSAVEGFDFGFSLLFGAWLSLLPIHALDRGRRFGQAW